MSLWLCGWFHPCNGYARATAHVANTSIVAEKVADMAEGWRNCSMFSTAPPSH